MHAAVRRSGTTVTVVVGFLVGVWSTSAGLTALQTALDVAYEAPVDRKFAAKRLRALPMMVVTFVLRSRPEGSGSSPPPAVGVEHDGSRACTWAGHADEWVVSVPSYE